ncbi:O-antigen ligase family protein [Cellvibrio sp. pealriver]|uniref:O-antigen ligase family protein n=1 Tax=Cellvibrio sp. pealriver TaxID=1622269 RepID=UPI00066FBF53|nr:O-antigen ligase family protein [Cellvibrio sp. pealriver]
MEEQKKIDDFYAFKVKNMWAYFKSQHFSFWMICGYLFFEFVKPQALFPAISIIPWAQLLLIGALAGVFTDPTIKRVSSAANILLVLFSIMIAISIFGASYPDVSKKYYLDFYSWAIIYFLIINIVNTKERFYIFLIIFIVAAGKIAFGTSKSWVSRGFSFTSWGLMGPKGYFQNSGELAILMLMLFPLAFYLYFHLKERVKTWEKILLALFWICPALTIMGASSRGAQIAFVVVLAFMFRKSIFKVKSLVGIVILCSSLYYLLPQEQKDRFAAAGDDKTSQQRLLYWENGWEMMKDHPLTGVGFFNFIPYYNAHYADDVLFTDRGAELPHNIFIQVGTDAGFIALFLFISLILYALISASKIARNNRLEPIDRAIGAGLGYGIIGYVIAGQFVTVTYYPFFWVHLAFIVSCSNIYFAKKAHPSAK